MDIEPIVIIIRDSPSIQGIQVVPLVEKVSFYADDTFLYLTEAQHSLPAALEIINFVGSFSGVRSNWGKSIIYPLTPMASLTFLQTPLKWVNRFKYLGIQIQTDLATFLEDNLYPVLQKLTQKCWIWKVPASYSGGKSKCKVSMSYLPKCFLYI